MTGTAVTGTALNSNLILLILPLSIPRYVAATSFKFQSDSINTQEAKNEKHERQYFKFQSDSINTYTDRDGRKVYTALNSNLILLILVDYVVYAPTGNKTLNSNLILLILLGGRMEWTLYRSLNSNLILLIQMTGQWLLLFSTTLNSNLILLIQHGFI